MEDRLRSIIDVLVDIDDPAAGAELARRAHLSRFHFDRVSAAILGESPAAFRRRLLLERAAYELTRGTTATDAAFGAGYSSLEAFTRAFSRAYGVAPSRFAGDFRADAPNGIHFHPPGGLLVPGDERRQTMDLTTRLVEHDNWLAEQLIDAAATLDDAALDEPVPVNPPTDSFAEDSPSIRSMLNRLVFTKEMWSAAIGGREFVEATDTSLPALRERLARAGSGVRDARLGRRAPRRVGHGVRRRNLRSTGELHFRRCGRSRAHPGLVPAAGRRCRAARARHRSGSRSDRLGAKG